MACCSEFALKADNSSVKLGIPDRFFCIFLNARAHHLRALTV